MPERPLLVVDGDSFAHRAYHGLPKTILRAGRKGGGAIVGFANFLLRLYASEQPRAVLVGWDTLDKPTFRHQAFPPYQSGREFDAAIIDQLNVLPQFVAALRLRRRQGSGLRGGRFPRRRGGGRGAPRRDRDRRERRPRRVPARLRRGRRSCTRCAPARWRASGRPRCASVTA